MLKSSVQLGQNNLRSSIQKSSFAMNYTATMVEKYVMGSAKLSGLESCAPKKLMSTQHILEDEYKKAKEMNEFEQGKFKMINSLEKTQQLGLQFHQKCCENARAIFAEGIEANLQYRDCLKQMANERIKQLYTIYSTH